MQCPRCSLFTGAKVDGQPFCLNCGGVIPAPQRHAGKAKADTPTHAPGVTNEAGLVREIKRELEFRGWRVMETGQGIVLRSGNTVGLPDLFVTHPTLRGLWVALEVKFGRGKARTEQQVLIDAGVSSAVWSVDEALKVCGIV